jgi:formate dehydrogenase major subunit
MNLTRRTFLSAGSLVGLLGLDLAPTKAFASTKSGKMKKGRLTTTICPYCAVGCSAIVTAEKNPTTGKMVVTDVEGDPDHPINEGTLCPKGASLYQLANGESRLKDVLYRAPGATRFEKKDWAWASKEIAKRIKKTRDETFTLKNSKGQVVNRTTGIASVGSAALDNEECWLLQKMMRSMGLVYIEHQARI